MKLYGLIEISEKTQSEFQHDENQEIIKGAAYVCVVPFHVPLFQVFNAALTFYFS